MTTRKPITLEDPTDTDAFFRFIDQIEEDERRRGVDKAMSELPDEAFDRFIEWSTGPNTYDVLEDYKRRGIL